MSNKYQLRLGQDRRESGGGEENDSSEGLSRFNLCLDEKRSHGCG